MLSTIVVSITPILAQSECDGERYRFTSTYENVSVSEGHVYGQNIDALGLDTELETGLETGLDKELDGSGDGSGDGSAAGHPGIAGTGGKEDAQLVRRGVGAASHGAPLVAAEAK